MYPPELHFNRLANASDYEAPILDLYQCICNGFVSSELYDYKRDDMDSFARVCSHVDDV